MAGSFYTVACPDCDNEQVVFGKAASTVACAVFPDCDNEQVVFGKAASTVACAVCGHTLAKPTGGEAILEGDVIETVEAR